MLLKLLERINGDNNQSALGIAVRGIGCVVVSIVVPVAIFVWIVLASH